jgi:predicted metal-dependent hydrolase
VSTADYRVFRSEKRRTLAIQVEPDLTLSVRAPVDCPDERIASAVAERRAWIDRQRSYFRQYPPLPTPSRYRSGETCYHLGRQYRLRIIERMPSTMVGIVGEYLEVLLAGPASPAAAERAMKAWYRTEAKRVFEMALERAWKLAKKYGASAPMLRLREMPGRWGSCSAEGTITLHPALVRVPIHCVRYVVMHEICHLLRHDHGLEFRRLLNRVCPDWRESKRVLECWSSVVAFRL